MAERRIYKPSQKDSDSSQMPERPPITPIMTLNDVARRWHRLVEDGAPTQFMQNSSRAILRELSFKTGLCQLDIARATHLKPPTISVALNKMENEGIVTRVVDSVDMRATRVYLTEKGKEINAQLYSRICHADEIALRGLTDEEKDTLLSLLERIRNNLKEEIED